MWILLWIVLSGVLIGATLWSLKILMRQKAAWEAYAKSKNLNFRRGTFMGPAEMTGVIGDYKLGFFTAERAGPDIRSRRYVTGLEINISEGIFDSAMLGTKEMLPFMQSIEKLHPYQIEFEGWDENLFAFTKHDAVMKAYLTRDRFDALLSILKTKNADVLVVFNDEELVLRLETIDPMQDPAKIDKIVTRLMGLCDKIRITQEERAALKALAPQE